MFGTCCNYVALRLLGVSKHDHTACKAQQWIHAHGGAVSVPSWGKFWLAIIGCYDWDGMLPIPVEAWLLPYFLPIHPGRFWCHTRMVYLPMSYLYATRFTYQPTSHDDVVHDLRAELYTTEYSQIDWQAQRWNIHSIDQYVKLASIGKSVWWLLCLYERWHSTTMRRAALRRVLQIVHDEDDNTNSLDIGPVNKAMNMLVVYHADGPNSDRFRQHIDKVKDFLWMTGRRGMLMNGTNGVQLWDTAFICQAALEARQVEKREFRISISRALDWLGRCQIRTNAPFGRYRGASNGAWPFSNRHQGYTVSDCTAEGLKAVLLLQNAGIKPTGSKEPMTLSPDRLCAAVDILLAMQNNDGGYASYEKARGPSWLEWFNTADVFGNIMIEYSYVECTTAVVLALTAFIKYGPRPSYRVDEIRKVCQRATHWIKKAQHPNGGWYGSWGVCFTYATWFAVEALAAEAPILSGKSMSKPMDIPEIQKACAFLVKTQRADGGWGESYHSCEIREYVPHDDAQVVNTAWAVMALMRAQYPDDSVITRGIQVRSR